MTVDAPDRDRHHHPLPSDVAVRTRAEVARRGLASFMNRTRWLELREAIRTELPFIPAWDVQNILAPSRHLRRGAIALAGGHDWSHEDMPPFAMIEWMRLVPRLHAIDSPLAPPRQVQDCSAALRALLACLGVPFAQDIEGNVWIYGYAPADPATLTPPLEGLP